MYRYLYRRHNPITFFRLEERQSRTYGNDPEYQEYFSKTPIMIPFIPLYSVIKWKWLVA